MLDASSYLKRIHYSGSLKPTIQTLRALHKAHLMAVPFENLDIHRQRPILLDEARFFQKIVTEGRGGFCYELNGLFTALLRELGFPVILLSAGVKSKDGVFGPDFDHLALLVSLQERWLVDVGFGDLFLKPLRLDEPGKQIRNARAYHIYHDNKQGMLSRQDEDGAWTEQYRFTLEPRRLDDFAEMCRYHQTSPDSIFTRGRICTRATPSGRVTLTDKRLTIVERGHRQEIPLGGAHDFNQALWEHFAIKLGDP